ncbi:hypothetical protein RDWZM_006374 [Blomia tropicalis]|uniref:Uncharacterized protein n=1 Tax=Blomia tropicalis TaxID=40697 RepID=A0A9Q0MAD2_BLOTA|nr:hypothetical protein RDWZM_006374 [Blomia tropicalis]
MSRLMVSFPIVAIIFFMFDIDNRLLIQAYDYYGTSNNYPVRNSGYQSGSYRTYARSSKSDVSNRYDGVYYRKRTNYYDGKSRRYRSKYDNYYYKTTSTSNPTTITNPPRPSSTTRQPGSTMTTVSPTTMTPTTMTTTSRTTTFRPSTRPPITSSTPGIFEPVDF